MDSAPPGNDIDIDTLTTALADIMSKDAGAVEKKMRIYFGLGLKSGTNLEKLRLDSGTDSWMFLREMMQSYARTNANVPLCIKQLTEVLKNIDLLSCATEIKVWFKGKITDTKVQPSREEANHLKRLIYNVEKESPNFIGRIDEIETLEKLVISPETSRTTVLTSVSGMGGIGKTMLARKFSCIFRDKYSGNVAWIPCDTLNLAQSAFKDIAEQLNLKYQTNMSVKQLAKRVYELLEKQPKKSLFIFDNLDGPDSDWIDDILPSRQDNIFGLITSRRRDLVPKYNTLDLDVFSLEDALELVKKHLSDLSTKLATKLVEELGYFPLALRIATCHISRTRRSFNDATRDYIQTFSFESEKIRTLRKAELDEYSLTTEATLKISLDKIGQMKNGDSVRDLLGLMSFLQPDEIEKELVVEIFSRIKKTESPSSLDDCLEILNMYSFITTEDRYGHYSYKIHRLVQKLIRFELKQEEKFWILPVVVDTLCDPDFLRDDNSNFILEILIEEKRKFSSDKKFICELLHRLLKAVIIKYEDEDVACCPGFSKVADNFIKRHLLNGRDTSFQLIPHFFSQMQYEKIDEPDPVMKKFFNGIYDQIPIEDPTISIVLLFYVLFAVPYSKYLYLDVKLLEKILGMDLNEINAKILPLEENGVISRICTVWANKVTSESNNDSNESNQDIIPCDGVQQNTTGSAERICSHITDHFSSIGNFFENYLNENLSRINLSLIDTILSLCVSLDFGIAGPLHMLHFKNNALETSKYLEVYGDVFSNDNGRDDTILELLNLVPDITYGDLYSMMFHTGFDPEDIYENVIFAIDALNFLAKEIPITKDLIIRISPLLSGKLFSHPKDYELPDELKLIKINVSKVLEQDTNEELTKLAFLSYLAQNTKQSIDESFAFPHELGKTLIKMGYAYEDDYQDFYLNPLVSCALVAFATIEEQFKFYQYVVRNCGERGNVVECGGYRMQKIYLNTWLLLYEKLLQQENLEFFEEDLLFPIRIITKLILINSNPLTLYLEHKLLESFSCVLHSVHLAINPVNIKWKKDLAQCFELLKMDKSLSFSDKLDKLLRKSRLSIYSAFVYTDLQEEIKLPDYPILFGVFNKFRSVYRRIRIY